MNLKPSRVTNLVALGVGDTVGSMSIVRLSSDNERLFQDLEDDGYIMPKAIPEPPRSRPSPTPDIGTSRSGSAPMIGSAEPGPVSRPDRR